jgi:hypothetical protein
MRQRQL